MLPAAVLTPILQQALAVLLPLAFERIEAALTRGEDPTQIDWQACLPRSLTALQTEVDQRLDQRDEPAPRRLTKGRPRGRRSG